MKDEFTPILSDSINAARDFLDTFDPKKDNFDEMKASYLHQAYAAAKTSKTNSRIGIAQAMGIDYTQFQYYMKTYPEFADAIQVGLIDGKEERKENLVSSLYRKAMGTTVIETKEEIVPATVDREEYKKITTTTKELPPDAQAIITLLRQQDPSWNETKNVNVEANPELEFVTPDKTISVDLKTMPPELLRQFLNSEQTTGGSSFVPMVDTPETTPKKVKKGRPKGSVVNKKTQNIEAKAKKTKSKKE